MEAAPPTRAQRSLQGGRGEVLHLISVFQHQKQVFPSMGSADRSSESNRAGDGDSLAGRDPDLLDGGLQGSRQREPR